MLVEKRYEMAEGNEASVIVGYFDSDPSEQDLEAVGAVRVEYEDDSVEWEQFEPFREDTEVSRRAGLQRWVVTWNS